MRIGVDFGADQRGSVHRHSAQGFDRGFRIADLPHDVSMSDIFTKVKRNVAEGYIGIVNGLTTDPEAYDAWFRVKVQEALADSRPDTPHDQVLQEVRTLIDGKRRA